MWSRGFEFNVAIPTVRGNRIKKRMANRFLDRMKIRSMSRCRRALGGAGRTKWPTIADTLQTQAPNHPHTYGMISRQPVRLSGARQIDDAVMAHSGEVASDEAAADVTSGF